MSDDTSSNERFRLRRRSVLVGAVAGAATGFVAGCGGNGNAFASIPSIPMSGRHRAQVAVVGAGLAGIACARKLAAQGVNALLLEARGRVGGRILNHDIGGGKVVEVGGQWIGPTQDRIAALASAVGVGTFATYNQGDNVDFRKGTRSTYSGVIPPIDGASEAANTIVRLDKMAAQVPLDAPWKAPRAQEWDALTFQSWMDYGDSTSYAGSPPNPDSAAPLKSAGAKSLLTLAIRSIFSAEPRDLSLLHVLFYIHSAGSLIYLVSTDGGAQQDRFVGGSQLVAIRAAEQLGDHVFLDSPVRRIEQDAKGVIVYGKDFEVHAERVVVAVPPTLAGRIEYTPGLPGLRDQLTQRMPMGTVIKVQCVYHTPFWRADGLSGYANSDTGAVELTYDNTPPNGSPGVLMGFIEGSAGRKALKLSHAERRQAVIDSFVRLYGSKAAKPLDYIEKSWADEIYSRGCYAGYMPPGVWIDYGPRLREPVGRIHWAGTETAHVWNGYMDGAVGSGERAAAEVMQANSARVPA